MSLFLNKSGEPSVAVADLFAIVRCDGGLGQVANNAQVDRVTYTKSATGTGQDRMDGLVNGPGSIIITAAPTGTTIPDGQGGTVDISLVGGATFAPDANGLIQVVYCSDNQMFGFDTGGNPISIPRSVVLYHELAHAFHRANGSFNSGDPEFQAETDENAFRAQVGLTLRDPNNHDGGPGFGNGESVPTCSAMTGCCC